MLVRNPVNVQWQGQRLWTHGNARLLDHPLDALLCSKACPGSQIIAAMDLAQRWRTENRAVIGGFHTPVEKECLRIFLRGPQPVVICPARGLDPFQLPADWRTKFQRNEMLIISLFDQSVRRPTRETAEARTRLIFVSPHATRSSTRRRADCSTRSVEEETADRCGRIGWTLSTRPAKLRNSSLWLCPLRSYEPGEELNPPDAICARQPGLRL